MDLNDFLRCSNSMVKGAHILLVKNKKDLSQAHLIRKKVFIEEQKVDPNIERDEHDPVCTHFLILYKNKPIGTCRIRIIGKKAKLERLAILKKYRGLGLGKLAVNHMVSFCKRRKIKIIYMNAQYYLLDYYLSLSFVTKGKPFIEAGIKHVKMYYKS